MNRAINEQKDWLQPAAELQTLEQYLRTIRERIWLVIAIVVVAVASAVLYVATAEKVYEAEVQILVSPVDDSDGTLGSLGLIGQSNDPLRPIETATELITTNDAAELASAELGLDREPRSILADIEAEPVAESDLVTVTATGSSPEGAAALANAFAEAAITIRTRRIRSSIDEELPGLEQRLRQLPEGDLRSNVAAQIDQLTTIRAGKDPSLKVVEPALPPRSQVSPRPVRSVLAGLLGGLILGVGAAFALQGLDPRLRREEQIRNRYRLPVLARIPNEETAKGRPLSWGTLSAGSIEAYRTLRALLTGPKGRSGATSVLITSPGPGEGKTTSAISLATSLALTGKRTILIEGDLRRPAIADALGVFASRGVKSVLMRDASLEEALVDVPLAAGQLRLLAAEQGGEAGAELLALPAAQQMVEEAKRLADFVIIDSPPLATVIDALPLARSADEIALVVRLGTSRLDRIGELGELLADSGLRPTGFVLVGVARQQESYYMEGRNLSMPDAEPSTSEAVLQDEGQLTRAQPLPFLTRVPREPAAEPGPLRWDRLSAGSIKAYRRLRTELARSLPDGESGAIAFSSAGPGDGKTTSAIVASLSLADADVILIEADLARPSLGDYFGLESDPGRGTGRVLEGEADLEGSLIPGPQALSGLRLLLASAGDDGSAALDDGGLAAVIAEAKRHASVVIVDLPPLPELPDPLALTRAVDMLAIVVRRGHTPMDNIETVSKLLGEEVEVERAGWVLVEAEDSSDRRLETR